MSSCLVKGSIPYAVICPKTGEMWVQGYEPSYCSLGVIGRKYTCKYFACSRCHRAFNTCRELKKHQARVHAPPPLKGNACGNCL